MQRSETIGALAAALAKAQGDMANAAKDNKNPHFNSRYADLASVWQACREPLAKNGLAVIQAPGETAERVVVLTTLLTHSSGEWIEEVLTIPMTKVDAQGYGSAVTYARRYALAAMVGIAPAEDDGNAAAAVGGDNNAARRAPPKTEPDNIEPEEGWSVWALAQTKIIEACDPDDYIADRKQLINALKKAIPRAYDALGKEIHNRREALAKSNPILEKEPA